MVGVGVRLPSFARMASQLASSCGRHDRVSRVTWCQTNPSASSLAT